MFSKHIRNFIFVLILFFILILFLILILTFIQGQTPPGMSKCVLGWCLPLDYQKLESPTPDEPVINFIVFLNMTLNNCISAINFIIIITKSIAIIYHFHHQHKLEFPPLTTIIIDPLCCHCHSHVIIAIIVIKESKNPIVAFKVHVDINVEILDILNVNDKEFSITMSM